MTLKGFSDNTVEKIRRLCDILSAIQNSEFIYKRLSLYGGTALNFLYLNHPRLSEDIDYNYRHIDTEDWGKIRNKIDENIKWILKSLGYKDENIKINSLYNQCRFHINYLSETGIKDDIKIEIGYMRRFPNLKKDCFKTFKHLTINENITVMTPYKEELFANKFATLISRSKTYLNYRDLFDVYSISREDFDRRLFLENLSVETMLMNLSYDNLTKFKIQLDEAKVNRNIEHLINRNINFENVKKEVGVFYKKIIKDLSYYNYDKTIDSFFESGELRLKDFSLKDKLNPNLNNHPQLKWLRKRKTY